MSDDDFQQLYYDETDDQLEELKRLAAASAMNMPEVRRILHAIEGAAGVMGHDNLRVATFEMCKRVERTQSAKQLLKVCDILLACNDRLRQGGQLTESSAELLSQIQV